jgi:hypothetical protein
MSIAERDSARKFSILDDVRVRLDVGGIVACRCGCDVARIAERELRCEQCDSRRGLLGDRSADFIVAVCAQFGAPTVPITLRRRP